MLPPLPNGVGTGVDDFPPNRSAVPGAGAVEVAPPPNGPPAVAGVVEVVPGAGAVEVVPRNEPAGLEPKRFPGVAVVVPVPVPVAGVVVLV